MLACHLSRDKYCFSFPLDLARFPASTDEGAITADFAEAESVQRARTRSDTSATDAAGLRG